MALEAAWIILVGAIVLIAIPFAMYNGLVRARNHCRESWSDVDTELKRRHDLIPNLVATVRGYAEHERSLFERVAALRSQAMAGDLSPKSLAQRENELASAVRGILLLVEACPQIKADQHFQRLQRELVLTEDRIQAARRFYNANVRDYNNRCQTVPTMWIAGGFGFEPEEFFEIEDVRERAVPKV